MALSSLGAELSWRRLLVLMEHLPPEAALNTAIRNVTPESQLVMSASNPEKAPWSTLETLVAALIDEVRSMSWMYASVHAKSGNVPKPDPIRRPGSSRHARHGKIMRMSEVRALDPRLKNMTDSEIRELLSGQSGETVPDD